MRLSSLAVFSALTALSAIPSLVLGLGTECKSGALKEGSAKAGDPYWYETIDHLGTGFGKSAEEYKVFRNVKDYGAVGDGKTDDTAAINKAVSDGNRCGEGCNSSTVTPAVVYFPQGSYLLKSPINAYYYTTLLGDAGTPPTLIADAAFEGIAVIDVDPLPGNVWFTPQNNFFRSIRNFVIDTTAMPASATGTGIHWRVAQATSINYVTVKMNEEEGTKHQGIYSEDGSGGFLTDFTTVGGAYGIWLGNQQFTVRNTRISKAKAAIGQPWNWGFTWANTTIEDCDIGFMMLTGGNKSAQSVGAQYILDTVATNVGTFVQTSTDQPDSLAGTLLIDNAVFDNVKTGVASEGGEVAFQGPGSGKVGLWGQGATFESDGKRSYTRDDLGEYTKPSGLTTGDNGFVFGRSRPQYEGHAKEDVISVKADGAKGDGKTDDTKAIQSTIDKYSGCKIIFFDAGTYLLTDTITVPSGTILYGEFFPVLLASGDAFADASKPKVVISVGSSSDKKGTAEITGLMISTVGGSSGAILIEWNLGGAEAGTSGMWDTHTRIGGAEGTELNIGNCLKQTSHDGNKCNAATLAFHIMPGASGYFENMWVWVADHDLEDPAQQQIDVFSARGVLIESTDPTWLWGHASEHHVLYQYNVNNAKNLWMGLIQTESPYYQPKPAPPAPYESSSDFSDPTFPDGQTSSWALNIQNSQDVVIGGAGTYSFFDDYAQTCLDSYSCQQQINNVDSKSTGIRIYSLATVGAAQMLSVDGKGIIKSEDNHNGFQDNALFWTSDSSSGKSKKSSIVKHVRAAHARRSALGKSRI